MSLHSVQYKLEVNNISPMHPRVNPGHERLVGGILADLPAKR
jgi:hypothetical protein